METWHAGSKVVISRCLEAEPWRQFDVQTGPAGNHSPKDLSEEGSMDGQPCLTMGNASKYVLT